MKVPFLDLKSQYIPLVSEILKECENIFSTCSFVGGSYVAAFEKDMQDYLGVKHAIGCGNGTDALMLALRACGVRPGEEVITTPFTFFATAEAIAAVGGKAVFVDIKQDDFTLDPDKIEAAITEKTKVILPVQIFGGCCDMKRIMEIAAKHGLKVIEDDAQAIGSTYNGWKAGSIADIGCFSFYPTKNLGGCGDGGMCTTNSDDLAVILRALREHGAGINGAKAAELLGYPVAEASTNEKATELYDPYKYFNYLIGYNSRLDAIQAAVLSIKLKHIDAYNLRRAEIARRYCSEFCPDVVVPIYSDDTKPCWHQFVIRSKHKAELCAYLGENGIGVGTFYPVPLHQQKAFNCENCSNPMTSLPNAERAAKETVCLPIFPEMTDEQVDAVIEAVNRFCGVKK